MRYNCKTNRNELGKIAAKFIAFDKIYSIEQLGNGNVNDTFKITPIDRNLSPFVLQRINGYVFKQPKDIINNTLTLIEHLSNKLSRENSLVHGRAWQVPLLLQTLEGNSFWHENNDDIWRASSFITSSYSIDNIDNQSQALEAGAGLAIFHKLVYDLPIDTLIPTIKSFHVTPVYYKNYVHIRSISNNKLCTSAEWCSNFIEARSSIISILQNAIDSGELSERAIHGDPKINNFMFDDRSNKAVSLIDLDTIMAGLLHYDISDCLRSCCNPAGEEEEDLSKVYFDLCTFSTFLRGYLEIGRDFLSSNDIKYLFDSIRLMPLELGIRFFTDYLNGNQYFKVSSENQNLIRAMVQFKLTESIEQQELAIRNCIEEMR
ncbi:MAG: aminoglycoside phosphotransferase family protein [Synechococcaceae bacterium WBA_2_066]|nr:aminoglycoside phosphotransferase family protein [Synechococcaceae bacterium WB6_1A_059]NBP31777.1 aminoglycoside phosphotransferase family protein [Synechococcaceae bacterium WB6_1B_055]NBP98186.1 aminoglycoside phosphotransferase family protein [Synechococcaceae bacterium WB6_3A_227]NBQ18160.1 aminoglycoside phosphotransferase family protein [Synechococcaceae bacterium WB5_2A_257]NBY59542.1 aminoglycoside phosphotransferase family protein [Synechococcaceae bacterium LLD_019]NCU75454.1 ami